MSCGDLNFNITISGYSGNTPIAPASGPTCTITGGTPGQGVNPAISPSSISVGGQTFNWTPSSYYFTLNGSGAGSFTYGGTIYWSNSADPGLAQTPVTISAGGASDNAIVSANYTLPIIMNASRNLNFGSARSSGAAGTVAYTAAGARTSTGGVSLIVGGGETTGQVSITTAVPNRQLAIAYPASVTLTSGASSMTVTGFASAGSPTSITSGTGGSGATTFTIGGTLNVGANQAGGDYAGTLLVDVVYQ